MQTAKKGFDQTKINKYTKQYISVMLLYNCIFKYQNITANY